jgi:hypothetical protein
VRKRSYLLFTPNQSWLRITKLNRAKFILIVFCCETQPSVPRYSVIYNDTMIRLITNHGLKPGVEEDNTGNLTKSSCSPVTKLKLPSGLSQIPVRPHYNRVTIHEQQYAPLLSFSSDCIVKIKQNEI